MILTTPASQHKAGPSWTGLLLVGVLLLLLGVLVITTRQRLALTEELMAQSLDHHGDRMILALESATRAGMRRGMYRMNLLKALVEEMADDNRVLSITIFGPDGATLVRATNPEADQETLQAGPRFPPGLKQAMREKRSLSLFQDKIYFVGRPFDPFRRFRAQGRRLPSWACPMDMGGPGGMGQHMGRHMGGRLPDNALPAGYALVRLSTQAYDRAVRAAVRDALLMALLIFLGGAAAALGLWAAARRRDREIARLRREVAQAEHLAALGRLAGSVAHEVRNPLSALRGLVQMLAKDKDPDSPQAEYARVAVEEVDRLERVVSGLLEYTRPRKPRLVPLDLAETLEATRQFMADDPRAREVAIVLEVPSDLPPVLADPDLVRQVLVNLIVNALEALNGSGRIEIRASRDKGQVRVEVRDDGPGLPGGDPEQLFDPFFSTRERGTGLGLAIARRIIRDQGGELGARPAPEGGALFTFTLPLEGEQP